MNNQKIKLGNLDLGTKVIVSGLDMNCNPTKEIATLVKKGSKPVLMFSDGISVIVDNNEDYEYQK